MFFSHENSRTFSVQHNILGANYRWSFLFQVLLVDANITLLCYFNVNKPSGMKLLDETFIISGHIAQIIKYTFNNSIKIQAERKQVTRSYDHISSIQFNHLPLTRTCLYTLKQGFTHVVVRSSHDLLLNFL